MVNLHVLLEFDHAVKERILEEHRRAAVGRRMWVLGVGLASLLAVLGVLYGYLRIDQSTAGAYRGRLRLAAAVAILGVVAAGVVAVVG